MVKLYYDTIINYDIYHIVTLDKKY